MYEYEFIRSTNLSLAESKVHQFAEAGYRVVFVDRRESEKIWIVMERKVKEDYSPVIP